MRRWSAICLYSIVPAVPEGATGIVLQVEVEQPNKPAIGTENFQRRVIGGFYQRQLCMTMVVRSGKGFLLICSNWQKQGVGGVRISLVYIVHRISFHD